MPPRCLYDILGVSPRASFDDIRAAYLARAKKCHPDLSDRPDATEEFQRLVNAFDILSDPVTRRRYDEQRTLLDCQTPQTNSFHIPDSHIMDSIADDILEELVVGNNFSPATATLATLMLDLARTSHFIMFREAKVAFDQQRWHPCLGLCSRLVELSPQNILYHFYLAEAARRLGRDLQALRHYRSCLSIGARRLPPQRLVRVRHRYQSLLRRQGLLGRLLATLAGQPPEPDLDERTRTQHAMDAYFSRAFRHRHNRPQLPSGERRQLPPATPPR